MEVINVVSLFMLFSVVYCGHPVQEMEIPDIPTGKGFAYKMCGPQGLPLQVNDFKLEPSPIQFGQDLTISLNLDVKEDIGKNPKQPINIDMSVILDIDGEKMDFCTYAPDYCHIKDVCKKKVKECPAFLKPLGLDCKCPLKKNTYVAKSVKVPLPKPPVEVSGYFNATIVVTEGLKQIGCVWFTFCLMDCDSTN